MRHERAPHHLQRADGARDPGRHEVADAAGGEASAVTTEEAGAGGRYGIFRRYACEVSYRLDGQAFIAREETLFESADEAFASMQPAA